MIESELQKLESLLGTTSPSTKEDEIRSYVESFNEESYVISYDALGNMYLAKPCENKHPLVMIAAHCDEIGLQIVYITDDGFIRFRPIGSIDLNATAGRQVVVFSGNKRIPGVICKTPIHIETKENSDRKVAVSDFWVDIGCSNRKEASKLVSEGDLIGFAANHIKLGGNRISSKALDNKLGVFVALSAMKRLSSCINTENHPIAVLTVQEEVGCKGAAIATQRLKPAWGICIDVGVATDCPGIDAGKYGRFVLGMGPGLSYTTDTSRSITDRAAEILKNEGIMFQKTVGISASGGTDTMRMQIAGNGVPCILLSIPIRSMHTSSEVCDINDVSSAIDVVVALIKYLQGI